MISEIDRLLESANMLFLKKSFLESIQIYEKILQIEPTNLSALNNKGYALSKTNDYQNAINCYDKGLSINPNEKTLLVNKISSMRKMKMLVNALDNCNLI